MSETATPHRTVHVVAGVLIDGGRVCITRRRRDAHQGGKWEFPGGKLEPGETPLAGLRRELREELDIDVYRAEPFARVRHTYPEFGVLLDVWRIARYRGVPRGREGQPLRWVATCDLDPREFPDADRPVLRRLRLPPLYLLSDAGDVGEREFLRRLARALEAGARLVQLREPGMDRVSFVSYAREAAALCHGAGARLLVNADPAWVGECAADGVHLNSRRLMSLFERPLSADYRVGASCHDAHELERAQALDLDFAVLGPVQPTASHPGARTLGWERLGALCVSADLPVYAIGGMQAGDLPAAQAAGARGIAAISGVWGREDFAAVVHALARTDESVREVEIGSM